jgi:hypothetical protein
MTWKYNLAYQIHGFNAEPVIYIVSKTLGSIGQYYLKTRRVLGKKKLFAQRLKFR